MGYGRYLAVLLFCAAWLAACAADWQAQQAPLITAEQATAKNPATHRRLFYVGLALYSEAWSQNDVVELGEALRQTTDFEVVPLIASNVLDGTPRTYPVADDSAIAGLVHAAAEHAGPDDVVFVHISTHGGPGVLARKIGDGPQTALTASALARQLAPLGAHRTVIVISACYSGSLIGATRSPYRIIITAARYDRSSFGCAAGNRHTFFGEAELYAFDARGRSLRQVFAAIRADVAQMEQANRFTPSQPQVSVGEDVKALYETPIF